MSYFGAICLFVKVPTQGFKEEAITSMVTTSLLCQSMPMGSPVLMTAMLTQVSQFLPKVLAGPPVPSVQKMSLKMHSTVEAGQWGWQKSSTL